MASQPANQLPLFYKSLAPLSSQLHPKFGINLRSVFPEVVGVHAVPVTVDEFAVAQRHYPIIFGVGDNAAPLALMALNEGLNTFVDKDGKWREDTYIPAYVRRYPFMLAKLAPESEELSLCFDDASGIVVDGGEQQLFDGETPSETTKGVLQFCEQFEQSIARTRAFIDEVEKLGLLTDGELTIEPNGPGNGEPLVYRGFRMVGEEKLQAMRGDQARKLTQNGMLGLIYAHLLSLQNMREVYGRQIQQAAA